MMKSPKRSARACYLLIVLTAILVGGCIQIRTTELRLKLNTDGSGEAYLLLTDIRSDGLSDSLIMRDYGIMMGSLEKEGLQQFERQGRKITGKQFFVHGDTLSAEITYTFKSLSAIEGLHMRDDELFFVIGNGREVLKTNGKIGAWETGGSRIVWDRTAKRLFYQIREKKLSPSTSLAAWYLKYGR